MGPEPSSHLHQRARGVGHGVVFGDLRSWSCVRADWSYQRMCACVYFATIMLYQAEHAELEDDSGVRVRSVWNFGDVDQSGAGDDKDHSK